MDVDFDVLLRGKIYHVKASRYQLAKTKAARICKRETRDLDPLARLVLEARARRKGARAYFSLDWPEEVS